MDYREKGTKLPDSGISLLTSSKCPYNGLIMIFLGKYYVDDITIIGFTVHVVFGFYLSDIFLSCVYF